ncbi:unnamed protein product [Candida verbasci]|uniref:Amino-acid acetyltransferase, mitochondrial n=1 Tax=Candida verbasci TaxID=1227364 RepID=A0A9W4TWN1_9ASCO|nr:unnamed protein product [Candida verbasci]
MTKQLSTLTKQFISNIETHKLTTDAKRNLILSILKSTTTKREAKNYLNKYQSQFDLTSGNNTQRDLQRELFINRYLKKQNPFLQIYNHDEKLNKIPLRIAIFKIKFTSIINWKGIAETFERLINLGISPIILLDYDHVNEQFKKKELYMIDQANKLYSNLKNLELQVLRSILTEDKIDSLESILIPLYQGIIPVIQPIVYEPTSCDQKFIKSDDLLYSLCSSLIAKRTTNLLTIEKIVFVDPMGGIPSIERSNASHVFINLSQEYSDILSELYIGHIGPSERDLHVNNLNSMNKILNFIFDSSKNDETTGIITTPEILSINNDQLNPIIYNVLTDRPIISSSLPSSNKRVPQLSTTIIKKGLPVEIYDVDNFIGDFTLENVFKVVDKDKLVDLLNDSFGKELDVDNYIKRINKNIATIVIVGDYDGAAIITWEYANGEKVAYLDKFAIAKKNQGLPGMADVIFKIILSSHPQELIWRSRKVNPVNKWYFERCVGCMSNADSQWKIFYTGEIFDKKIKRNKNGKTGKNVVDISKKLLQYNEICENIEPSFQ